MTVYLLTMPDGTFGSAGQSWERLNLDKVQDNLDFNINIRSITDIKKIKFNDNDILIYTSSENEVVRNYLKNSFFYLKNKVNLIPSYELLMAHEDKGFQEVLRSEKNFGNVIGNYLFDIDTAELDLPKVLKKSQGAGSSGVFLVKTKKDLKKIRDSILNKKLKEKAIHIQRKIKLKKQKYKVYSYRKKNFASLVEQDFIPDLKHDFKVLVFGDRYLCLKRNIRKNDFRASGSGNFEFIEPPCEVLDFAKDIATTLDGPYFSLDIAQSKHGCHLIEFQASNFGPYTLLNAPSRYVARDGEWIKEENCKNLEGNYAYALNYYIKLISKKQPLTS